MNNFQKYINLNLLESKKRDGKMFSTVEFDVEIPLSYYDNLKDMSKDYAVRDTKTAIDFGKKEILKLTKRKNLPISIKLKAILKQSKKDFTVFRVVVTGGDEKFLTDLFDAIYD